jgi:molecular chaperone GrpE (heat shock protein)
VKPLERYSIFYCRGHDGEMDTDETGDWVRFEDAQALQKQLDEKQHQLAESHRTADELRRRLAQERAALQKLRQDLIK